MTKIEYLICGRRAFDTPKYFVKKFGTQSLSVLITYADRYALNYPYYQLIKFANAKGTALTPAKQQYIIEQVNGFYAAK